MLRWLACAIGVVGMTTPVGAQPRKRSDAFAVARMVSAEGRLTFAPMRPHAGQRVAVTYQSTSAFHHDSILVLRGVFRAPEDWIRDQLTRTVVEVTRLRRGADGRFRGAFTFPDGAAFGRVAIGSVDSLRADSRMGRHWTLLAHGRDGRPTASALSAAAWDEMQRNDWVRALATAERLTALHPDEPGAWLHRQAIERGVVGDVRFAAKRAGYLARLAAFDSMPSAQNVRGHGDRLGQLYWLAFALDDTVRARHLRARLLAEAPLHPLALQERMADLLTALRGQPAARLDTLEALWRVVGPAHRSLFNSGFGAARTAKDTAALRRWGERAIRARMLDGVDVAAQYARLPGLAHEAVRRLAAALDSLDRGLGHRLDDVGETLDDVQRRLPARRREILTELATASIASGDSAAALAHYLEAAATGWSPPVFRAARALAHARGDTANEQRMSALLAADPLSSDATRDSIRSAIPAAVASSVWEAYLARGEAELVQRVRLQPPSVDASAMIRLASWGQTTVRARSLARGRPTVVALWSMGCPYSRPHLPTLARMDSVLARRGIDLLVVTRDEPSADLATFVAAQRAAPPIHHDLENTVGRTFTAYGYPWFFVLDGRGQLVAKGNDINAVAAEAVAAARRSGQ